MEDEGWGRNCIRDWAWGRALRNTLDGGEIPGQDLQKIGPADIPEPMGEGPETPDPSLGGSWVLARGVLFFSITLP